MNPEAPLMPHETVSYPDLIKTAADLARNAHEGQSRKSGEPYFKHCEETAHIIYKEWGLTDPVLIAAAYTHDVVEDTTVTLSEVSQLLGPEVAFIVEGVSEFKSAQAIGLLVDGKRMPVSTNAQNASVVEVLVSEELRRAPSPEFLNYCLPKTAEIIASQLRMKERDSMIEKGKQITEKVLEPWGIFSITDLKKQLNEIISYFGCRTVDDFHYKMAITSQNSMELKRWLNEKGISKESLDLTSIRLTGKDKEGTLNRFTDIINKLGGNIVTSTAVAEKGVDSEYFVELVVKGLHSKGVDSDEVKSLLLENNRFSTCLVI